MSINPAAVARIVNALTEAAKTQDGAAFAKTEAELRAVHGRDAMAAAYERISDSTTIPPADWS